MHLYNGFWTDNKGKFEGVEGLPPREWLLKEVGDQRFR